MFAPLTIVHIVRAPSGGIFRHINDLARAQTAAGHRVALICDPATGGPLEKDALTGLERHLAFGVTRIPMQRALGLADAASIRAAAAAIHEIAPDIVHAHGAKGGVFGRLAAVVERRRGRTIASFYAPHGGSLHYDSGTLSGRFYFAIERLLEFGTDGLIHVSEYEARTYRQKVGEPRCPAHVVRNGIRPEEFAPVVRQTPAADLLYVGILRDLKGFDVLLQALALLRARGRRPSLLVVGYGEEADMARYRSFVDTAGLSDQISFRAPMPAGEAFELARLMVVPSRAESMPYIVLEAAAAGIPLIATEVGGIPEILTGAFERLVRPGDPQALAEAIAAAVESPDKVFAEAVLRRESIRERFSLASMADRIEAIYRQGLDRRYRTAHPRAPLERVQASR